MKKAALIFVVFLYAFSTTGISLEGFYCCGKLKSVKLTLAEYGKGTGDCCKTTFRAYKISDVHIMAEAVSMPDHNCAFIPSFDTCIYTQSVWMQVIADVGHAPPLHFNVPLYISDCVYRI